MFFNGSPAVTFGISEPRTKENVFNYTRMGYRTVAHLDKNKIEATAKTAIIAEISREFNISFSCLMEELYFQTVQLKAFANGATNLSLHFDLTDGKGRVMIADFLDPLDVVTAVATPQTGSAPIYAHVSTIVAGAVASDVDIAILSDWSVFSLSNIMHANDGLNDKSIKNTKISNFIKNTGYFATGMGMGNMTPFAPALRIRAVSTAALTCIDRSLVVFAKVGLTSGLKDIHGNG